MSKDGKTIVAELENINQKNILIMNLKKKENIFSVLKISMDERKNHSYRRYQNNKGEFGK